jgi:hypothetical protein
MKKYIRSNREYGLIDTEEYRGYFIDHYNYGDDIDEYVVDIDLGGEGDIHTFISYSDATDFIDDLYLVEKSNKKLGY